jgi:hypothetical protein
METGTVLFSRRVRQNHALEHATVTILARDIPKLNVSARSNARGFTIYAPLDPEQVRAASTEALARLQAGEARLAIHPNCGTNLAVGTSVAMIGSLFALNAVRPRTRVASAVASSLAGFAAARPLGRLVQRHVTTLPDLRGVRIVNVTRRSFLRGRVVEVVTAVDTPRAGA